jgi:UDP-N-acetylglucosamine:LPS N-acetylglucosamine transferase
MKKILILTCNSAGAGHLVSSQAVKQSLKGKAKVKIIDFYRESSPIVHSILGMYGFAAKNMMWLYGLLYDLFEIQHIDRFLNYLLYKSTNKKTAEIIKREKPNLIISVHSYSGRSFLEYLSVNSVRIPTWSIIIDPITFHRSWLDSRYDLILVATQKAYNKAIKFIPRSKVKNIGSVIRPKFYKSKLSKNYLRNKYNLSKDRQVILFLGGGEGLGFNEKIISKLIKKKSNLKIIAICGKNKKLFNRLKKYPIDTIGFTNKVDEYMRLADVVVGKAGPATLAEAILCRVPVVMTGYVYGQEKGNVDYILNNKLGVFSTNVDEAINKIENIIQGNIKLNNGGKYRLDRGSVFLVRDMVLEHLYGSKPLN